jgi:UDP-N-acetylglucosamine 2-epimerase
VKVVSVVGARPQFVKLGPVSRALRARGVEEFVLHTGQHYDPEMSESFFAEFELPPPDVNLGLGAGSPAQQLGTMIPGIAEVLAKVRPDMTIVFGDTNTTLAAALAAAHACIPLAHVESGMRSFDRAMPEEINRVATDHLSQLLLTASAAAEANLRREGFARSVFTGDVMYDVALRFADRARGRRDVLERFGVSPGGYAFATMHRAGNTDDPVRLRALLGLLDALGAPVVFPVHPRTLAAIAAAGLGEMLEGGRIRATAPLPYVETLALVAHARRVFTDSGGLQKEAFYLGVPCTTLRDETEWVETVELGWNVLVGTDAEKARVTLDLPPPAPPREQPYGDGTAGEKTAAAVVAWAAA